MGFVGGLLGTSSGNSGAAGMNYQAGSFNPYQAFTPQQITDQYNNAQSGLTQQQNFVNALNAQNGIQNQSNVFNQLQGVANGTGANPAQAMLNQSTGQNVANQAALMAGQRGAGANTGLIARQAAQQGAATQQNAVGQAATLQANQSLGALNQLGGIAGQQVGQQANAIQGYNQAAQGEQSNILGAVSNYNNVNEAMQANANNANAGIAGITAGGQQGLLGGALGGLGASGVLGKGASSGLSAAGPLAAGYDGGIVRKYADGGDVPSQNSVPTSYQPIPEPGQPQSWAGQFLKNQNNESVIPIQQNSTQPQFANKGALIKGEQFAAQGRMIPGKAKVKGDSLKNDNVPAILSPGEIIIPRSVAQSKDAPAKAAKFVSAVLANHGKPPKKSKK